MYFFENWHKFVAFGLVIAAYYWTVTAATAVDQIEKTERAVAALGDNSGKASQVVMEKHLMTNAIYGFGAVIVLFLGFLIFLNDLKRAWKWAVSKSTAVAVLMLLLASTGCKKPFEPVKLEVIKSNEEAFLIPLTGDNKKQEKSNNEEFLKSALVYVKQVQIPQQWVPKGHESWGWNGAWQDAAMLIKVDKTPVTRKWTADEKTGTSTKDEAIWVMTSDQVEFSTGWSITAYIKDRDDAVKFLHNYPNGSLTNVLDSEIHARLQTVFGLEVTDLPMDTLRKAATPHIAKTVESVTEFFKPRGITITTLGISGGFVYKDKSILDTLVKVFNSEQEKAMAIAKANAQLELNKAVISKAEGEAEAILKTKEAEAKGIKAVADARMYELEKAAAQLQSYMQMKQIELNMKQIEKWDGQFPHYFLGGGGGGGLNMLLQLPPEAKSAFPPKDSVGK